MAASTSTPCKWDDDSTAAQETKRYGVREDLVADRGAKEFTSERRGSFMYTGHGIDVPRGI
jgi:hypothetical protein